MKNYVKIILKELKNTLEDFLAVIGLSWDLDQKRSGTELTMAYRWILESNGGDNAAELRRIRSSDIPLHLFTGKRTIKKQRGKNVFYISQHVKRMYSCFRKLVMSVNQLSLYGAVADLIEELLDDQRAPGKPVALDQTEQEILIQPLLAEVQANEERQRNLLQNCKQRFE